MWPAARTDVARPGTRPGRCAGWSPMPARHPGTGDPIEPDRAEQARCRRELLHAAQGYGAIVGQGTAGPRQEGGAGRDGDSAGDMADGVGVRMPAIHGGRVADRGGSLLIDAVHPGSVGALGRPGQRARREPLLRRRSERWPAVLCGTASSAPLQALPAPCPGHTQAAARTVVDLQWRVYYHRTAACDGDTGVRQVCAAEEMSCVRQAMRGEGRSCWARRAAHTSLSRAAPTLSQGTTRAIGQGSPDRADQGGDQHQRHGYPGAPVMAAPARSPRARLGKVPSGGQHAHSRSRARSGGERRAGAAAETWPAATDPPAPPTPAPA